MELVELIRGAQDAMDRGDYPLATAAGAHALDAYPTCLAAHRILGEAHLELGSTDVATTHFQHTLAVDPLNVVARLGLGVAAEEQKDYRTAYGYYLNAWEINPSLDQIRDELVRLRGLLGIDGRLHPTRSGLASMHTRGGQLLRAANEWRAVLVAEPQSRRARTALAELLWRQGEDRLAVAACREVLNDAPTNARVLAVLAEIECRNQAQGASDIAARYRAVDPTGELLPALGTARVGSDLRFLTTASAIVNDFDFAAFAGSVDQRGVPTKIATNALAGNAVAAPDLWDTLVKDLSSDGPSIDAMPSSTNGVVPFAWDDGVPAADNLDEFADLAAEKFGMPGTGALPDGSPAAATNRPATQEANRGESSTDTYAAVLSPAEQVPPSAIPAAAAGLSMADEEADLAALFAPASNSDLAAALPPISSGTADLAGHAAGLNGASGHAGAFDDLADLGIEPFSFDGMPTASASPDTHAEPMPTAHVEAAPRPTPVTLQPVATPPPAVVAPVSAQAMVAQAHAESPLSLATAGAIDALTPELLAQASAVPFEDPFVTADGRIDLTAGWDDLDRSLAAATPSLDDVQRFADIAADLDFAGITPFDANIPGEDDDAWAPMTEDDFGVDAPRAVATPAVAPAASPPSLDVAATARSVTDVSPAEVQDHDGEAVARPHRFDDEVIRGIPAQQASGYTELLRHVATDELNELIADPVLDPFSNPDASGSPLAFEDLVAVTSRDGTAPLVSREPDAAEADPSLFDFSETDPSAAIPAHLEGFSHVDFADLDLADLDLSGFDPFDGESVGARAEVDPSTQAASLTTMADGASLAIDAMLNLVAEPPTPESLATLDDDSLAVDDRSAHTIDSATDSQDAVDPGTDGLSDQMVAPFSLDDSTGSSPLSGADHHSGSGTDLSPFDFDAALAEVPAVPEAIAPLVPEPIAFEQPVREALVAQMPSITPITPIAADWSGLADRSGAAEKIVWPAFSNQTSELIDRDHVNGSIFRRLRASKGEAVASGLLTVDRSLAQPLRQVAAVLEVADLASVAVRPDADDQSSVPSVPIEHHAGGAGTDGPVLGRSPSTDTLPRPGSGELSAMSEQTRSELMATRVRLIDDPAAAGEIATTLEQSIGDGLNDPLALRILGEAYLKLGRMEQAAAQFRQAMAARRRSR